MAPEREMPKKARPHSGRFSERMATRSPFFTPRRPRKAATRLVRGVNALGYPALAMPCGISAAGLPVGLQLIGPAFEEALLLRVGAALEDGGVGIPPCPMAN